MNRTVCVWSGHQIQEGHPRNIFTTVSRRYDGTGVAGPPSNSSAARTADRSPSKDNRNNKRTPRAAVSAERQRAHATRVQRVSPLALKTPNLILIS